MEKITLELLAKKLKSKLTAQELGSFQRKELDENIVKAINESILEVAKEVHVAKEYSNEITGTTNSKIDAFKIFWYAVGASFATNILASTFTHMLTYMLPHYPSIFFDILTFFISILFLGLLFMGMANEIIKFWRDGLRSNTIVSRIFKDRS
ncbi:hypothetical protein KW783_02810 [Candidatus Parcubacteria bacterium]|nr:hypothetical protein [Candidatus Parcubacteria bacterium]